METKTAEQKLLERGWVKIPSGYMDTSDRNDLYGALLRGCVKRVTK